MDLHSEPKVSLSRLQRPPVRQSVLVRSDMGHTFSTFVHTIASWWPLDRYSTGKQAVRDVHVEECAGGRISEIWEDGTVVVWGEILRWEPPQGFLMTWTGTSVTTEVEFTFMSLGPALTQVTVEHRGWETLSDAQWEQVCPKPGGYLEGWRLILGAFVVAIKEELTGTIPLPSPPDE